MDKEYKKRQAAMKKRLKSLGSDNPVVSQAIKDNEPQRDTYKEFAVVDELVSAARNKYRVDGNFKACVQNLSEALGKLASGENSEGLDTGDNKGENKKSEENY